MVALKQFVARIYDADNKVISNPHFFAKDERWVHIAIQEFKMKGDKVFVTIGGKPSRYILSQTHFTNYQEEILADYQNKQSTIYPL